MAARNADNESIPGRRAAVCRRHGAGVQGRVSEWIHASYHCV